MDPLVVVAKLQKIIRDNLQRVGDSMISGSVDNMEKYQYMLGQARTYQYMLQEISVLLKAKEQKDEQGNIINLERGNSKSPKRP
jgi:hypothetical protein